LRVANRLAPKSKQVGKENRINKDLLIEKICHQLIEHLDDTQITTCDDLVQAVHFLEANATEVPI